MTRATCPRCGDILGRREFDLCDYCRQDVFDLGITRLVSASPEVSDVKDAQKKLNK